MASGKFSYEIGYGKRAVPVYRTGAAPLRVTAIPESPFVGREHGLLAAAISVEVLGEDFLPAYTAGDNSMVVATDSMKNFILRETLAYHGATLEGLLAFLGTRFVATYDQLRHLRLSARALPFSPVPVPTADGFGASGVLFERGVGAASEATLELRGDGSGVTVVDHRCALVGLRLMKLSGSAFTAFVRDGYTTLPERRDRPLYVFIDLHWRYANAADLLAPDHASYVPAEQVRDLVATVFDGFVSESIQHLVHEMGKRLLGRFPPLAEVGFVAENRTRDPAVDFPEGATAKVYTDPFPAYGEIRLTMRRAGGEA